MKKQKILVVSDTHKMHVNFDLVLEKEKPFDVLFHAGDVEGREWEIEYGSGCPAYVVAGNNDFFGQLPPEVEIKMGPHKIFMTLRAPLLCLYDTRSPEERSKSQGSGYCDLRAYT